ncbi:hypothetical protein ACONUD_13750 [Microbulbifer harenosus]|uniref:Uncharacterized protein n=1 Tax=Microbulbifer harenosus TaxID=2576840 RepID=A0ABY2URV9_9GAMM|nr:hypothetical protein [Microbulbifer harenosus]TLM79280.1 hypothetical protein FDY93_04060 [Microbulbifer harenosus]
MFKRLFASKKHPYTPFLNQREKVEVDLSGTKLSMVLPPHTRYDGFGVEPPPARVNIHDAGAYQDDSHLPEWRRSGIVYRNDPLGDRNWEFYGPPWSGRPYGFIEFRPGLRRLDGFPDGVSCFNPAHFEQVLVHEMYYEAGPGNPATPRDIEPINWRLTQLDGATCIYFESHRDLRQGNYEDSPHLAAEASCGLYVPLEDRYFLRIGFNYSGYAPAEYSLANMNRLRDSVLETVTLEYSPSARQQLESARQKWPNACASERREPLEWVYPEWRNGDYLKGEKSGVIILKAGSPPPEFTL